MPNEWTPQSVVLIISAISGAISLLFAKPAVDAIIRLGDWWMENRKQRMAMKERDYKLNDTGHKRQINWYDNQMSKSDHRIEALEQQCAAFREEATQCREEQAAIRAKCELLEKDNQVLHSGLQLLRSRLELLAPGIGSASDSKVRRYFQRLEDKRQRELKLEESGELNLDHQKEE